MQRVLDFLRVHDLPPMTRPNYLVELRQVALWGVVVGAVEGSIASIVASKTFRASEAVTTLVWALPAMINVLNLGWSTLIRGRPRVATSAALTVCGVVGVASIGLTPRGWAGAAWVFAGQVAFIHLFLSALITLRTTMWQMNYPDTHRARITGRLTTVRMLLALGATAVLSKLFDWRPTAYMLVYPLVAGCGLLSLLPLRRMRVRGERAELRRLRAGRARVHPWIALVTGLRESRQILRQDRAFAQYMVAQFLLGAANFFTEPLLINVVTKRLALGYFESALLVTVIPTVTTLIGIRYWAPLYDRVGVLQFRIINSTMWGLSYIGTTLAMVVLALGGARLLPVVIGILVLARVGTGLGSGGGALAWNLGHLAFARPPQTELYMGIHVALTGFRALVMPLLSVVASRLVGDGAFGVSIALAAGAHVVFRRMNVADRAQRAAGQ